MVITYYIVFFEREIKQTKQTNLTLFKITLLLLLLLLLSLSLSLSPGVTITSEVLQSSRFPVYNNPFTASVVFVFSGSRKCGSS